MANDENKINENLLYALINKGGSVPSTNKPDGCEMSDEEFRKYYTEIIPFQLRMPRWLTKQIDDECKRLAPVFHSRHGWIMDAIISKLAHDGFGDKNEKVNIIKYEPIISKTEIVEKPISAKIAPTTISHNLSPVVAPVVKENLIIDEPISLLDMLNKMNRSN